MSCSVMLVKIFCPRSSVVPVALRAHAPAKQSACSSSRTDSVVGVARVALLLAGDLGVGAEQVLHVVAVLVGQHVRLGELALGAELVG